MSENTPLVIDIFKPPNPTDILTESYKTEARWFQWKYDHRAMRVKIKKSLEKFTNNKAIITVNVHCFRVRVYYCTALTCDGDLLMTTSLTVCDSKCVFTYHVQDFPIHYDDEKRRENNSVRIRGTTYVSKQ
uniref:Uncharacterized protein n=1 Tax=Sipha flava TaxID=143950 RepID=A0A2S2QCI3_9HEMI